MSAWRCKSFDARGDAHERWHITSTDLHPASFPRLNRVVVRGFTFAVAFHGFGRPGVLIGGRAPITLERDVRRAVAQALAGSGVPVEIAQRSNDLGGRSRCNVVNRLTASGGNGVHIEQSLVARERHWKAIADAVAAVYESRLPDQGLFPGARRPDAPAPRSIRPFTRQHTGRGVSRVASLSDEAH